MVGSYGQADIKGGRYIEEIRATCSTDQEAWQTFCAQKRWPFVPQGKRGTALQKLLQALGRFAQFD